jgi:hypothetical protein
LIETLEALADPLAELFPGPDPLPDPLPLDPELNADPIEE